MLPIFKVSPHMHKLAKENKYTIGNIHACETPNSNEAYKRNPKTGKTGDCFLLSANSFDL